MVAFAFGAANRWGSPPASAMLGPLCARALCALSSLTPQGLANLGWGLAVGGHYPPPLIRAWRAAVGARAGDYSMQELGQLHLAEAALRLEAPHMGEGWGGWGGGEAGGRGSGRSGVTCNCRGATA